MCKARRSRKKQTKSRLHISFAFHLATFYPQIWTYYYYSLQFDHSHNKHCILLSYKHSQQFEHKLNSKYFQCCTIHINPIKCAFCCFKVDWPFAGQKPLQLKLIILSYTDMKAPCRNLQARVYAHSHAHAYACIIEKHTFSMLKLWIYVCL